MAVEISRQRIGVEVVRYDDGSKGIAIEGFDGVHMGFTEADAKGLLQVALTDAGNGEAGAWITTDEICATYGVARRTVYRWQHDGRLHGTKAGRRLLFRRDDVLSLLGKGEGMGVRSMSANCE